jgi:tRNA pseudouridine55 synthase
MDGLLVIDKPAGLTSHDVVNRVRRILGTKRVGHTGTLDPFATGVMVILVGQATRLAQFIDKDEKEYEAVIRVGYETDTGDVTGSPKSQVQSPKSIVLEDIERVLSSVRGVIEQVPPMYSAKKIDGKKLYEHARKGVEVERKAQRVTISELEIVDDTGLTAAEPTLKIRVVCSAGTYIRVLAEDIGKAVGVGAHLTELRRTRSGRFGIEDALTVEALAGLSDPSSVLLPMERAVEHLGEFILPEDRVAKTRNGMSTRIRDGSFTDGETLRMISTAGDLIAMGRYSKEDVSVKPTVVLV